MTDKKMWADLRKKLQQQGCSIEMTRQNHYKIYLNGQLISIMQHSASCRRSYLNQKATLRKKGIVI